MIWALVALVCIVAGLGLIGYETWVRKETVGGPQEYDDDPWSHPFVPIQDTEGVLFCAQPMEEGGTCDLTYAEHMLTYPEQHAARFFPEDRPHKYVPNKQAPGCCAYWLPTRDGGQQQCLMSKGFHDD